VEFWRWLGENWGWLAAPVTAAALWFRQDIAAILTREYSADRAASRERAKAALELERERLTDELKAQDRTFELVERTATVVADFTNAMRQLPHDLIMVFRESTAAHTQLLQDILDQTRDNGDTLNRVEARLDPDGPPKRKRRTTRTAAVSIVEEGPMAPEHPIRTD
jgi:hypothetical protein